jgi:hypothetical protein
MPQYITLFTNALLTFYTHLFHFRVVTILHNSYTKPITTIISVFYILVYILSHIFYNLEFYLMFCLPCITVYQYSETNVMHVLLTLLRIKGLNMFRALLAHLQEALKKRNLVHCVRVMSVGCYQVQPTDTTRTQYNKFRLRCASWRWASNAPNMYIPLILNKLNKKCITLVLLYWLVYYNCAMVQKYSNISFEMYLPEHDPTSGRNM